MARKWFCSSSSFIFSNVLTVLGWVLGASGFKLGSDWAPWLQIDVSLGSPLVLQGQTLGELGSSLINLGGALVSI